MLDFRIQRNAAEILFPYHANMPRKSATSDGINPEQSDWYLREWMKSLKVSQAKLARECDWTPSTMHGIYHGRTSYYRDIVNLIALKLNIEPYELLMPPETAFALRRQREDSLRIVEGTAKLREVPPSEKTGTDGK